MSRIDLTEAERNDALTRLGYTPREAAFLVCAALQSGFFLRRQFCQFIHKEVGGTAAALIERLIAFGHATGIEGCRNTQVYHLNSRPFYAAIGDEDNRNRRLRPPTVIKSKLMSLDFVLDFPDRDFMATEAEKVAFFTGRLGIDAADLPAKDFRSPTATDSTTRHFVDKYPLSVNDGVVQFTFIDEGLAGVERFASHLNQYMRLWTRLPQFELVYVADSKRLFHSAHRLFERFCKTGSAREQPVDVERLLHHFADRRAYAEGALHSFDRSRLLQMRDDRQLFSGRAFEVLFDAWKNGGEEAIRTAFAWQKNTSTRLNGCFQTHLLEHSYDVFGTTSRSYAKH